MNNSKAWYEVYDQTDFGNKYPFSYLVTLFHRRIKPVLTKDKKLADLKVLDFGCSYGANSIVFQNAGCEVFGIDISPKTIEGCIAKKLGDSDHFKCMNLLSCESLDEIFPGVQFDLIVASECMYYFTDREHRELLDKFVRGLSPNGMIYASYPSFDTLIYRNYAATERNADGMIEIAQSGSIEHNLFVNLPDDQEDLRKRYAGFQIIDILQSNLPVFSSENEMEYHVIAQKEL